MSARRILAALAALLGVAALTPVAAGAANHPHYDVDPGHLTRFEFGGSKGYEITVSANDVGYVTVKATKRGSLAQYVTAGRVSGLGASATLPGLGRVSFDFTPTGPVRRLPGYAACSGDIFVRKGIARGVVRFRGERGYTRARAHRARAELISWPRQRCRYQTSDPGETDRRRVAELSAFRLGRPAPEFTATRFSPGARPYSRRVGYSATLFTPRPEGYVFRSVTVAAKPSSFRVPAPRTAPENLTVTPPRPFSGSGELRRSPESTFAWRGSLRVTFPGTMPIRLTGPAFAFRYCALRSCLDQFPERSQFLRPR